ncbi:MAG TPA: hypothetical protein VGR14_01520 [Verrucomicrobiae bacterium]|jgi:hypothetical protein|nr:hypothetical protein [Verrucomicrobiae bacterium]
MKSTVKKASVVRETCRAQGTLRWSMFPLCLSLGLVTLVVTRAESQEVLRPVEIPISRIELEGINVHHVGTNASAVQGMSPADINRLINGRSALEHGGDVYSARNELYRTHSNDSILLDKCTIRKGTNANFLMVSQTNGQVSLLKPSLSQKLTLDMVKSSLSPTNSTGNGALLPLAY